MAIVKADGYGHGAETVAKAALKGGANSLGIATLEEGIELRKVIFALKLEIHVNNQRKKVCIRTTDLL